MANRQILDGVLVANEASRWTQAMKNKMLFKVDFTKAYASMHSEFLDSILLQMNSSEKWHSWIHGCISSPSISVLVNGCPTNEFTMVRGLRQGDPLSPFLFIIAAEALHVMMLEAVEKRLYTGAHIGDDLVELSHLQFADDVLFLSEWSVTNAMNLLKCLK